MKTQYKSVKEIKENYKTENILYITIWGSISYLEVVGETDYPNILKLVELCLTFVAENSKSGTGFYYMKTVEDNYRSQLDEERLPFLIRIVIDLKPYAEHSFSKAAEVYFKTKKLERKT